MSLVMRLAARGEIPLLSGWLARTIAALPGTPTCGHSSTGSLILKADIAEVAALTHAVSMILVALILAARPTPM